MIRIDKISPISTLVTRFISKEIIKSKIISSNLVDLEIFAAKIFCGLRGRVITYWRHKYQRL